MDSENYAEEITSIRKLTKNIYNYKHVFRFVSLAFKQNNLDNNYHPDHWVSLNRSSELKLLPMVRQQISSQNYLTSKVKRLDRRWSESLLTSSSSPICFRPSATFFIRSFYSSWSFNRNKKISIA